MSLHVAQILDRWMIGITIVTCVFAIPSDSKATKASYVISSVARLRESPKPRAPVVETLRIGAPVQLLNNAPGKRKGKMVHVKSTRHTGYISKHLLSPTAPTLKELMTRYDQATSLSQKRKWIERATAFAPSDEKVIRELITTLQKANKAKIVHMAQKGLIAAERRNLSWDGPLYPISDGIAYFPQDCKDSPARPAPSTMGVATDRGTVLSRYTLRARAFPWVNSGKVVSVTEKGYRTQRLDQPLCSEQTCGKKQLAYRMEAGHAEGALLPSWLVAGHRVEPLLVGTTAACKNCHAYRNVFDDFSIEMKDDQSSTISIRTLSQWVHTPLPTPLPPRSRPIAVYSEREKEWYVLWQTDDSRSCCPHEKQVWITRMRMVENNDLMVESGRLYSLGYTANCPQAVFQDLPGEPRCERLTNGCELSPP